MRAVLLSCFTATLSLCTAACAPTLPVLIAAHRYDEAICLEDDGRYHAQYNPELTAALVAELKPTLFVHAFTPEEIDHVFAPGDSAIRARAREANKQLYVVGTRISRQAGSTQKSSISVYLKGDKDFAPDLAGQDKVAAFYHETLPTSHQEGPGPLDHVAAWGKDVGEHPIANMLTLGIWSALNGPPATSKTIPPTDEDFLRMAPITTAMTQSYPWRPCGDTAGGPCNSASIYLRPKDESTIPLFLQFAVSAESFDEGGVFTSARTCRVYESLEVELPTGGTIEERFAAAFQDKIYSYDEVARMRRRPRRAAPVR